MTDANKHDWRASPSTEDLQWASELNAQLAPAALAEAAGQGNVLRIQYIVDRYFGKMNRWARRDALRVAIDNQDAKAITALFCNGSADVTGSYDENSHAYNEAYDRVIKARNVELLTALYKADTGKYVGVKRIVQKVTSAGWLQGYSAFLKEAECDRNDTDFYQTMMRNAVNSKSDEWLKETLLQTEKFMHVQNVLNAMLVEAATLNTFSHVEMLLEAGANPSYSNYSSVWRAVENRNIDMLKALVAKGVDFSSFGDRILSHAKSMKEESAVVDLLEEEVPKARNKTMIAKQEDTRYSIAAKSILKDMIDLQGGPKLTTLFNFETRQQIIIVDTRQLPPVCTVKDFSEIDSATLERHQELLIKLGGEVPGADLTVVKRNIFDIKRSK